MEILKKIDIFREKCEKLNKILFSFTLFIILLRRYIVFNLEQTPIFAKSAVMLFYFSVALLILQFLIIKEHNITEIAIFLISCVLYVFTKEGAILVLILVSISIKDIDDEYVVKNYLIMNAIFLITVVLIGNYLPDMIKISEVHYRLKDGIYIERNCFGLHNPNLAFLFSIGIYAAYIFLRFDKYNLTDRIILLLGTFFIYKVTLSRTGFITMLAGLGFVEIVTRIDLKKYKSMTFLIKILPIFLWCFSIILGLLFSKNEFMNVLLASRPKYWNRYLIQEGNFLNLFGNSYSLEMKLQNPLDNSYIYLTVMLGILSVIFFMMLLYKGLDILIKQNAIKYVAVVAMFLVYTFAENILFEAGFNFTIILLIKCIILDDTLKNKVKFRREKNVSITDNAYIK